MTHTTLSAVLVCCEMVLVCAYFRSRWGRHRYKHAQSNGTVTRCNNTVYKKHLDANVFWRERSHYMRLQRRSSSCSSAFKRHPNLVFCQLQQPEAKKEVLVFEYAGEPLRIWSLAQQKGLVAWRCKWSISQQLREAIRTLHMHGVVHTDIRPANVLVQSKERGGGGGCGSGGGETACDIPLVVRVCDLGNAICIDSGSGNPVLTSQIMGTEAGRDKTPSCLHTYTPDTSFFTVSPRDFPERCVDWRLCDWYSWAVIVFVMFTGKSPYVDGCSYNGLERKHVSLLERELHGASAIAMAEQTSPCSREEYSDMCADVLRAMNLSVLSEC